MKCCETKKFVEMSLAQFLNSTNRIRARRASIHQFQFYSNFCQQQFEMVIVSTFPTTFVLFVYLCAFHSYCVCETNDRHSSDKILSRKRRHLIFPKGSSIQLVYDSVLTVPDYTIYIVTGVTCALAWGLPDKPIYPENDLMDHYEDGELPGLQYRIDANVTENASSRNSTNANRLPATANSTTTTIDNRTLMNLFRLFNANVGRITNANANVPPANVFGTIPQYRNGTLRRKTNGQMFEHLTNRNRNYYYKQTPANVSHSYSFAGYSSRNRNGAFEKKHAGDYSYKPWINRRWNVKTPKITTTTEKSTTTLPPFKPKINKLHTVYTAIGKRSVIGVRRTLEERFYLDHHRESRFELYNVIEKYLFARGHNGTACILKTLCEVGAKRNDASPGSFLAEIVRVVFSLPAEQSKRSIEKRHIFYDEAHRKANDCADRFPSCPGSIWTAGMKLKEHK